MRRTLYLHIGAHRTATTATQKFLKTNFVPLQKRGYFNPYAAGRHFRLFNKLFSGQLTPDGAGADLESRADEKHYPIHSVVLSDEDICTRRDLSLLAEFSGRFDVKVIFVLRRQDLWIESWYQQNVKWQWNPDLAHLPFADFLARRADFFWIDYDGMVARLEALFGAGNVTCLVFEKDQMPQGPAEAVCAAMGLTDLTGFSPAPIINRSLSPLMTEFMRHLPLDEIAEIDRRVIEQACVFADRQVRAQEVKRMGLTGGTLSSLFMDAATRAKVLAEYAVGNAALAERLLDRPTLFLDPLPAPDAPLATQALPGDGQTVVQDLIVPFMRGLSHVLANERANIRTTASASDDTTAVE